MKNFLSAREQIFFRVSDPIILYDHGDYDTGTIGFMSSGYDKDGAPKTL